MFVNRPSELTKNPFLQMQLFSKIDRDGGGSVSWEHLKLPPL